MNKADLINVIASESGLSKSDSKKALDAFVAAVSTALKQGDKVALVGFGTFSISERGERTGINPSTKEVMTIPAKKVVKFRMGVDLAENIQ